MWPGFFFWFDKLRNLSGYIAPPTQEFFLANAFPPSTSPTTGTGQLPSCRIPHIAACYCKRGRWFFLMFVVKKVSSKILEAKQEPNLRYAIKLKVQPKNPLRHRDKIFQIFPKFLKFFSNLSQISPPTPIFPKNTSFWISKIAYTTAHSKWRT